MQSLGLDVFMPPFLNNRRQFSTEESNRSRCITKIRWIVEGVNRCVKEFKYFANTVQNSSLIYLQADISNICALINRYRPPIATSKPDDVEIAKEMRSLITKKDRIETVKLEKTSVINTYASRISVAERKQFVKTTISQGNHWPHRYHPWVSNTIRKRNRWYYSGYEIVTKSILIKVDFYCRCVPIETCTILCWRKNGYIKSHRNRRLYHSAMPIIPGYYSCSNSVCTQRKDHI